MLQIRRSDDRGHFDHGWLNTYHTFSFGHYRDPNHVAFRSLRVMNEDRVAAGAGFGEHGHADMEIISYVLEGGLEHRDSMGNGSVLGPGMFQRMSAGTGVQHSEFNTSQTEPLHFYQIWVLPERPGIEPGYEEHAVSEADVRNRLHLVAARTPSDGAMRVHQDVSLYLGRFDAGVQHEHELAEGRHAWVQVTRGAIALNGVRL